MAISEIFLIHCRLTKIEDESSRNLLIKSYSLMMKQLIFIRECYDDR